MYDVKNKFEKALRSQNKYIQQGEKNSILYDQNNNPYVKVENDILENVTKKDLVDLGTSIKSLNKNKEVWTSDGRPQV